VRAAARAARLPVEDRPFRPHLTLAFAEGAPRAGRTGEGGGEGGGELAGLVAALAGFASSPWMVEEVRLVHSRPAGGCRPVYETVGSWPMRGAPGPAAP
jgi:2'-5' RNA ligase